MTLKVAIVGDSAMWGQGLAADHTYAHLSTAEIAQALGENGVEVISGPYVGQPQRGFARSGAKLQGHPHDDPDQLEVLLPVSGEVITVPNTDAAAFCQSFPKLFDSDAEMRAFIGGESEAPAGGLFGEHPAPFPSVRSQLRDMLGANGASVDLLLMDGGINDIDFEKELNPESGPSLSKVHTKLQGIFETDLLATLVLARQICPRAVIVVVGYFAPFSPSSSHDQLKGLMAYMEDIPDWLVEVNDFVQGWLGPLADVLSLVGLSKDTDQLINDFIFRTQVAQAAAHFWSTRTIAGLPDSVRGPGVVYAYPAIRTRHGLFTDDDPFYWPGYKPPDAANHRVADEMKDDRIGAIPRRGLTGRFEKAAQAAAEVKRLMETETDGEGQPTSNDIAAQLDRARPVLKERIDDLMTEDDLPGPFVIAARSMKPKEIIDAVNSELGRIHHATIASFAHPNVAGARRMADRIVSAWRRHHRGVSAREALRGMAKDGESVRVAASLRRHGIDTSQGIRRLRRLPYIDSIAMHLTGVGDVLLVHPVAVTLGDDLTFSGGFVDDGEFFVAWVPDTDLHLSDITEVTLMLGAKKFESVTLFFNGREVFHARDEEGARDGMTIRFPLALML